MIYGFRYLHLYPECAALLARETPLKVSGNPLKDMLLHLIMVAACCCYFSKLLHYLIYLFIYFNPMYSFNWPALRRIMHISRTSKFEPRLEIVPLIDSKCIKQQSSGIREKNMDFTSDEKFSSAYR